MTPPNLITVGGNLREGYMQLQPNTMLHVDELTNERRTNPIDVDGTGLRKVWFYTADGELYHIRKGTPFLSMTRGDDNPLFYRIDDAFAELTTDGNFQPTPEEAERALGSYSTVHTNLTELRLQGNEAEWRYLAVQTKKKHGLKFEEEKLARRVFGDDTFDLNMEMFRDAGITESKIYVLNPNYVKQQASERPVGRASWLDYFNIDSYFNASDRNIYNNSRVRGVRRGLIREADALENGVPSAPEKMDISDCYNTLLANETKAAAALDNTRAAGLSKILTDYLSTRKK